MEALQPTRQWQFGAIGTSWWIGIYEEIGDADSKQLQSLVVTLTEQYDKLYSRFRPDSLVTKWSHQAGTYPLPPDAKPLLDLYAGLYQATKGAVTPLVGQLLSDAGYDAQYSLKPKRTVQSPRWEETLSYAESELTLKQPALLDFGAAGKGYLVDQLSALLERQGITQYCVDGSGDMRVSTAQPLAIGLENPTDAKQVIGVAQLASGALCGSAGNRRVWGQGKHRYTHIMNPFSRQSPDHLQAVWVTADSALLADGLTTALYFTDPNTLAEKYRFEYALVKLDNSLEASSGFPGEFFTRGQA